MILALKYFYEQIETYWNSCNLEDNPTIDFLCRIKPHYNVLNIPDLHYRFYNVYDLKQGIYLFISPIYIRPNTFMCNWDFHNWLFQSWGRSEVILNQSYFLRHYKITNWYQPNLSIQVKSFDSLNLNSEHNPYAFTLGRVSNVRNWANPNNNTSPFVVGTILDVDDNNVDIGVVSRSAPIKTTNSKFFRGDQGNKALSMDNSSNLKLNNLKYTLDSYNLSFKTCGDTTPTVLTLEYIDNYIFLLQYLLLFITALLFLFINTKPKLTTIKRITSYLVLRLVKYTNLLQKKSKNQTNYIFNWWGYY